MTIKTFAAVRFDLDGVLVDAVEGHIVGRSASATELGVPFDPSRNDGLRDIPGERGAWSFVPSRASPDQATRRHLLDLKAQTYLDSVRTRGSTIGVPGFELLLAGLRHVGARLGMASASQNVELLMALAGLDRFVEEVLDGYFVGSLKPHPAQLLDLAGRHGAAPGECLVVEDALAEF